MWMNILYARHPKACFSLQSVPTTVATVAVVVAVVGLVAVIIGVDAVVVISAVVDYCRCSDLFLTALTKITVQLCPYVITFLFGLPDSPPVWLQVSERSLLYVF